MIPNAEILISTELIRMILDLPPSYKVVAARTTDADFGHTVRLVVEANELPPVRPGDQPHLVTPRFGRVETGRSEIAAIDVQHSQDCG
jgi:hypothetical protein